MASAQVASRPAAPRRKNERGNSANRRCGPERTSLLRAFGAEDRDRNRFALRNIIAVDAGSNVVAQPDSLGALDKAALRSRFHQREPATALPEEIRGARSVGQHRRGAGHEDEARLVKARGGRLL